MDGVYRELYDGCGEDIGDGEDGRDNEPGEWDNEDTDDEFWEHSFHLVGLGIFSAEYIGKGDEYEEKSEDYVDDITDENPYLMEDGTESENLSEGPIGREEPSGEHNERCNEECKNTDEEIGDVDKRLKSFTLWFRCFCIIGSWGCCSSSCRSFFCHCTINTTLRQRQGSTLIDRKFSDEDEKTDNEEGEESESEETGEDVR